MTDILARIDAALRPVCGWCHNTIPWSSPSQDFCSEDCQHNWTRRQVGDEAPAPPPSSSSSYFTTPAFPPLPSPADSVTHTDGETWWYDAPVPRRWHRCRPWTTSTLMGVERCACGAIRYRGDRFWLERNSTRKDQRTGRQRRTSRDLA